MYMFIKRQFYLYVFKEKMQNNEIFVSNSVIKYSNTLRLNFCFQFYFIFASFNFDCRLDTLLLKNYRCYFWNCESWNKHFYITRTTWFPACARNFPCWLVEMTFNLFWLPGRSLTIWGCWGAVDCKSEVNVKRKNTAYTYSSVYLNWSRR